MIFKVRPFNTKAGTFAPALYVDSQDKRGVDVPPQARKMSGLGRFESWDFSSYMTKIRQK